MPRLVVSILAAAYLVHQPSLCAQDVGNNNGSIDGSGNQSLNGLAAIEFNDEESTHRALEGARLLAESGAGFEAARVVAAIATQMPDEEVGREAKEMLTEWGLTLDDVRTGSANELNVKIKARQPRNHRHLSPQLHVRNLVALGLCDQAADVVLANSKSKTPEREWDELRRFYRIPKHVLDSANSKPLLVAAFQKAHELYLIRNRIPELHAVDRELFEIAREAFSISRDEPEHERHDEGHRHYERYVERDDDRNDDNQDSDHDDDRDVELQRELNHLTSRLIGQAIEIAKEQPDASRLVCELIQVVDPDSLSAKTANRIVQQIAKDADTDKSKPEQTVGVQPRMTDPGSEMFGDVRIRNYRLTLSAEASSALKDDPKKYVRATFHEGDKVYENVGVRLKGGWGSFRILDDRSKSAFTIKFNQFVKEQRFHGLRRIVLNNAVQDSSYLCEYVGYRMFRDAGIPAPRINFANLRVNDEVFGLYVQVEAVTKDFLSRWFAKTKGNLYEGPGDVVHWEELDLDSNQNAEDRSDLRMLAHAVEEADEEDPWAVLSRHVDVDAFVRFVAMEELVNHWDGYWQVNNYRMYRDPESDRFFFMPHGCDQLFENLWEENIDHGGILGRALLETEQGQAKYQAAMRRLLDHTWDPQRIRDHLGAAYPLIHEQVAKGEGRNRTDLEEFEHQVAHIIEFISLRAHIIDHQLRRKQSSRSWRDGDRDRESLDFLHDHN